MRSTRFRHGADALGFVFWRDSPQVHRARRARRRSSRRCRSGVMTRRRVRERIDRRRFGTIVAQTGISAVQLHGDEPAEYAERRWAGPCCGRSASMRRTRRVRAWPVHTTFLVDADRPRAARRHGTRRRLGPGRRAGTDAADRPGGRPRPSTNVADAIVRRGPVRCGCVIGCRGRAGREEPGAAWRASWRAHGVPLSDVKSAVTERPRLRTTRS